MRRLVVLFALALGLPALAAPRKAAVPAVAASLRVRHASDEHNHRTKVKRTRRASSAELRKMRAHLATLRLPQHVKHSFELFGDQVDCVDVRQQPSLRAPRLVGHQLQSPPEPPPAPAAPPGQSRFQGQPPPRPNPFVLTGQDSDAQGKRRACPEGTIPVRRSSIDELASFRSLSDFFRKHPSRRGARNTRKRARLAPPEDAGSGAGSGSGGETAYGPSDLHQYAHAAQYGLPNYGARSAMSLWNPLVTSGDNEFSLGQLWLTRGDGSGLQTLEVGVQEFPDKYGDHQTRLFVYSTSDGYSGDDAQSGCYNLDCARFVQTNPSIVLGAPFAAYSAASGEQHEIELAYQKDGDAWWVWVGGQAVGYYPVSFFADTGLKDHADNIDFGGEIIDDRGHHAEHTSTAMGSGAFAEAGYGIAAYHRRITYYDTPTTAQWASGLAPEVSDAHCYDIGNPATGDAEWGSFFFFGGPGYSSLCQ